MSSMRVMSTYTRKEGIENIEEDYVLFDKKEKAWFFLDEQLNSQGPFASEEGARREFSIYCEIDIFHIPQIRSLL